MQSPVPQLEPGTPSSVKHSWIDPWHVSPSLNKDYDVIDGLRGIAILLVVACHVLYHNPASGAFVTIIGGVISAGAYGVTVFFALSGFLISLPFWKRKSMGVSQLVPPGYIRRRFWKIYPPLALSLFLLTPIYFLKSGDTAYFPLALQWLAGFPLIGSISGELNPVMWSLIVEVHFYATLPLLFLISRKLDYHATLVLLFTMLLVIPFVVRGWNLSHGIQNTLHPSIQTHYPSNLDAFACGVLVGGLETIRAIRKSWVRCGDLGLLLLGCGLLSASLVDYFGVADSAVYRECIDALFKIAAGLLILYIADPGFARTRALSATGLRWLGLVSYEWYLFHQPIFRWTRQIFGGASGGSLTKYLLIVGISIFASLALAAITYRFFSLPILRWGRGRAKSAKITSQASL